MLATESIPKPRRGLSADALHQTLRRRFEDVPDTRRQASCKFSMADTLMSAFAMFATKEPSMLSYLGEHRDLHIEKPFQIAAVPPSVPTYVRFSTASTSNRSTKPLPICFGKSNAAAS